MAKWPGPVADRRHWTIVPFTGEATCAPDSPRATLTRVVREPLVVNELGKPAFIGLPTVTVAACADADHAQTAAATAISEAATRLRDLPVIRGGNLSRAVRRQQP